MAATDATNNRRIFTALQAMGYGADVLGSTPPDTNMAPGDFTQKLTDMGITSDDLKTATALSQYGGALEGLNPETPSAPPGMSDLTWRGIVQNYQTADRSQTMAEASGPAGSMGTIPFTPPPTTDLPLGPGAVQHPEGSKYWPLAQGGGAAPGGAAPAPAQGKAPAPAPGPLGGPGGKVTPRLPVTEAEKDAYIKAHFGSNAWFLGIPEVKKAMEDSAAKGGTADDGLAAVQSTNWWKTTQASVRTFVANQAGDPATANAQIDSQVAGLQKLVTAQGFSIDPARLRDIATNSLKFGWNNDQINENIGAEYSYHTGQSPVAGIAATLKGAAGDMLIPLSDQTITQWGKDIISGKSSVDEFSSYAANMAKSMYPQLSNSIDRGVTVKQYVQPYQQLAGKELDVNPDTIDMTDPKWSKALNQVDPKTGERQVMSLADWQTSLRQMPDWATTQGAHQQVAQYTNQLATDFGMKP